MHPIQKAILEKAKTENVLEMGIRPLGRLIGINKPQLVKHHLLQLQKKGFLKPRSKNEIQEHLKYASSLLPSFFKVPVVGMANCGEATFIAEEKIEDYITVSETLLKMKSSVFALIAKGDSMNKASIQGNNIEENDYVLIDGNQRTPRLGDYILSVIDGMANIKKFAQTKDGNIALLSESTSVHPTIYISASDNFFVNGKVIQVIKAADGSNDM